MAEAAAEGSDIAKTALAGHTLPGIPTSQPITLARNKYCIRTACMSTGNTAFSKLRTEYLQLLNTHRLLLGSLR